jgi:heme/copper-type cytochrome/quinol oxidase subunit 2
MFLSLAPIACLPAGTALAADSGTNIGTTLINPLGAGTSLPVLLGQILSFVVNIGAIIVIFMLVYVGFLFVTARGNETKLTAAKQALLWTVVGALILLGAKAIAIGICQTANALSTGGSVTSCVF